MTRVMHLRVIQDIVTVIVLDVERRDIRLKTVFKEMTEGGAVVKIQGMMTLEDIEERVVTIFTNNIQVVVKGTVSMIREVIGILTINTRTTTLSNTVTKITIDMRITTRFNTVSKNLNMMDIEIKDINQTTPMEAIDRILDVEMMHIHREMEVSIAIIMGVIIMNPRHTRQAAIITIIALEAVRITVKILHGLEITGLDLLGPREV